MSDTITRTDHDGLVILTLNRPEKLNSLNTAMFEELLAHVEDVDLQPDAYGCVIIRGAGRCFSAGHDLGDIGEGETKDHLSFQASVIERLANLPQAVISAVHGHCYTGALELALAGDLIAASANARFADTHAKWALTPIWGMSQRLPRRIGQAKAREMMLTCRTYTGAEAYAMNLANFCFPDESFETDLLALAGDILKNSRFSIAANKRLLRETDGMSLAAGLAHEVYRSEGTGPDMTDRIAAFSGRKA